jgi:hypothetical protein
MKKLVMMVLLGLILAGCGSSASSTATPAGPVGTAAPQLTPLAPGMGVVEGVVVDENNAPIEGLAIYVAKISTDGVISYSPEADPRGFTNAEGRFTIVNVAPATYAMAYWTPGPAALILNPDNPDEVVKVEVQADQTSSTGTLKIKRP